MRESMRKDLKYSGMIDYLTQQTILFLFCLTEKWYLYGPWKAGAI